MCRHRSGGGKDIRGRGEEVEKQSEGLKNEDEEAVSERVEDHGREEAGRGSEGSDEAMARGVRSMGTNEFEFLFPVYKETKRTMRSAREQGGVRPRGEIVVGNILLL